MINLVILHRSLLYTIASVWLINGLFCKILNYVPRHELIVARILGSEHAYIITKAIGFSEVLMTIWIISLIRSRLCATMQILIISTMNSIEFIFASDLLLFGKLNAFNALLFVSIIYYNEFILAPKMIR